ncbi:MAG: hypothetical protein ACXQTR_01035 [Candidatus Methanospirareceae archaeon]
MRKRWACTGVDRESGDARAISVEADNEREVVRLANNAGVLVESAKIASISTGHAKDTKREDHRKLLRHVMVIATILWDIALALILFSAIASTVYHAHKVEEANQSISSSTTFGEDGSQLATVAKGIVFAATFTFHSLIAVAVTIPYAIIMWNLFVDYHCY